MADERKVHEERVKRELKEQEEILAKVKADSDRYDEAVSVTKKRASAETEPKMPAKPEKGDTNDG